MKTNIAQRKTGPGVFSDSCNHLSPVIAMESLCTFFPFRKTRITLCNVLLNEERAEEI